jgi:hypothetical protein
VVADGDAHQAVLPPRAHGGEVRLRSDGRETVAELELPTTPAKFG